MAALRGETAAPTVEDAAVLLGDVLGPAAAGGAAGRHRADVHEPRPLGGGHRGVERVGRSFAVGGEELRLIHGPGERGDVIHDVGVGGPFAERAEVAQIPLDQGHAALGERRSLGGGAHQGRDLMAAGQELVHQVAADEAGGAGQEGLHRVTGCFVRRASFVGGASCS